MIERIYIHHFNNSCMVWTRYIHATYTFTYFILTRLSGRFFSHWKILAFIFLGQIFHFWWSINLQWGHVVSFNKNLFHIASQTAEPIGLNFFVDNHGSPGVTFFSTGNAGPPDSFIYILKSWNILKCFNLKLIL